MALANRVFVVFFVVAAALQFNDPDPYIWIPVYLGAAAWTVMFAQGKPLPVFPAITYVSICLGGAAYQLMALSQMPSDRELLYESLGLLICCAWTTALLWRSRAIQMAAARTGA